MTVQIFKDRQGQSAMLLQFSDAETATINDALQKIGIAWQIDAYGDTKLTDANIAQVMSALARQDQSELLGKARLLQSVDVCYAIGE